MAVRGIVDKAHSEAEFQVRHLVVRVRGGFTDFEGTIQADEQNPGRSSVKVTIQAASIDAEPMGSRRPPSLGRFLQDRRVPGRCRSRARWSPRRAATRTRWPAT